MPLDSQKNQIKDSESLSSEPNLLELNQQESDQNKSENVYINRVLAEANQQINIHEQLHEQPVQSTIIIPESQEHKAGEIGKALGLSFGVTLNSAVKYAIFHAQNKGVYLKQLEEYPSSLSSHSLKLKVTADTWQKLRESNMTEYLSECVFTGIELLYKQLIGNKKRITICDKQLDK
jgi:hypothetical protein